MANYYDYIGARPDATQEEIQKAVAATEIKLKQTGAINTPQAEMNLRNIRETLLNAELRKAYNAKLGLTSSIRAEKKASGEKRLGAKPVRPWQRPGAARTQRLLVLVSLVLILGAYFGYTHWASGRVWPTGSYLVSVDGGVPEAVILERESSHLFSAGRSLPAYRVKMLKTGQITWATDRQAHVQWRLGDPAPASVLQEDK